MDDEKVLLTVDELAAKLGISRRTVFQLRKEGLPVVVIRAKAVRYDLDDVLRWLKSRPNVKEE